MNFQTNAQLRLALDDVRQGVSQAQLWLMLGWQDIRQRFRRSMLGPFWLTLSTAFMLVALGLVYATLFKMTLREYFPFLAAGIVSWTLISGLVSEGCATFIASDSLIKQIRLPYTIHACRVMWRNVLIFFHNIVIIVVVMAIFDVWPTPASLACLAAGLALVMLNGVWVALFFGIMCARFRDIPPIVASLLQLFFFLTPIIWHPSLLPGRQRVIDFNPFFHFIEILRGPMLGAVPAPATWAAVLGITAAGWLVTLLLLLRARRRISYWL
jgi:ABC-type polysaccharide/polyol phosphate export permease